MISRDKVGCPVGLRDRWCGCALALWITPLVVIAVLVVARPGYRTVTKPCHQAVDRWWAQHPLYEGPKGMNYLPHFPVLFTPYHLVERRLGEVLWRCTAWIGLAVGLGFFSLALMDGLPHRWRAFAVTTILVLPLSLPALRNGQANAHFAALLLLTAWCLWTRRWGAAAICLWLSAGIKPLGLAALGLACTAYPQLGWRLALGLPVFLGFPFLFGPPGYVWSQWTMAGCNLCECLVVTQHRFADLNGLLRTLGIPLGDAASMEVRAEAGILVAFFCYLGIRRVAEPQRALVWLSAAAAFLMLFNPMTEANSYVILAPALALLAWWELSHGTPSLGWVFAGMVLTMGLLPNALRPLCGNHFALAWHPAMTIGFLAILVTQVLRSCRPDTAAAAVLGPGLDA